jgi:hypothetical protein
MAGLGKKKEEKKSKKLSKNCQKVVKRLSNILSNLVKINKKRDFFFLKIDNDFGKLGTILKIGYDFEFFYNFENWV